MTEISPILKETIITEVSEMPKAKAPRAGKPKIAEKNIDLKRQKMQQAEAAAKTKDAPKVKRNRLINPKTAEDFALSLRTPGTFLHKLVTNQIMEGVLLEDVICNMITRIELRSAIELAREERRLQEDYEAKVLADNKKQQFIQHPRRSDESQGKSIFEIAARVDELKADISILTLKVDACKAAIYTYQHTIQDIDQRWEQRQAAEAQQFILNLKDFPMKPSDVKGLEKAFIIASPVDILSKNPTLTADAKIMCGMGDIVRVLNVCTVLNKVEQGLKADIDVDAFVPKPADLLRLIKQVPVPKHTRQDELDTKAAIFSLRECRKAEMEYLKLEENLRHKNKILIRLTEEQYQEPQIQSRSTQK